MDDYDDTLIREERRRERVKFFIYGDMSLASMIGWDHHHHRLITERCVQGRKGAVWRGWCRCREVW